MADRDQGPQPPPGAAGVPPCARLQGRGGSDGEQSLRLRGMDPFRNCPAPRRLAVQQAVHGHWADLSRLPDSAEARSGAPEGLDMFSDRGRADPGLPAPVGNLARTPPGVFTVRAQGRADADSVRPGRAGPSPIAESAGRADGMGHIRTQASSRG
jgi:hypothetical protein